jgi:hypothetical protein
MRCLANGGLELEQVSGGLDCSGTGTVKHLSWQLAFAVLCCAVERSSPSLLLTGPITWKQLPDRTPSRARISPHGDKDTGHSSSLENTKVTTTILLVYSPR